MKKIIFSVFLFLFASFMLLAQKEVVDFAKEKINERGEVYFSFDRPNQAILNELAFKISIDKIKNNKVFAYANKSEFDNFLLFNIPFEPVYDYYSENRAITMANSLSQMVNWDRYPSFSVYQEMMQNFVLNYPSLCRLDTIGFSAKNNRPVLCLVISNNINQIEDKPEFFWSATMHGDELCGLILTLRFADYLLSNYGSITQVDNIVNNAFVYICPMANPDGTYKNSATGNSVSNATRYNGNNVDLNRSFPYIDGASYDFGANADSTQAEVVMMQNYANLHNFTMAANLHGGASLINYPWDLYGETSVAPRSNIRSADEDWWLYVCHIYADLAIANSQGHTYASAGYFMDCANEIGNDGITEGSDWYWISGSRQDYMNYFKHCREVTIEVSVEKKLDVNELNNHWNFNRQAMLDYTEQVLFGFRGVVTDACNNSPLSDVKVEILGHDNLGSEVYSFAPLGNYFRPIYEGNYNVTFSKDGYISQTLPVTVTNNNATILNVQLQAILDNSIADFNYQQNFDCSPNIIFQANNNNIDSCSWDFGDNSFSNELNTSHIYQHNGIYNVVFTAFACGQNFSSSQEIVLNNIAEIPNTIGDESCNGANELTLWADGSATINWYDNIIDGNLIATGNSYTNIFSTTTTYYVENQINTIENYNLGPNSNNIGNGGFFNNTNSHYLVFNAEKDFVLNSVLVYSNQSGNRTIQLIDNHGDILDSKTVNIPNNQDGVRIDLDFNVPAANNYKLALAQGNSRLYRNTNGANYPYSIESVLSITANSSGDNNYYYYFYDWDISLQASCTSQRVPVTATVIDNFENISYSVFGDGSYCADSVVIGVFSNDFCSECNFYWQGSENNSVINDSLQGNSHYVSESGTYYFRQIIAECISEVIPISVTLFEPVKLSYSTTPLSSATANDASITINVISGTPDFTGMWSNNEITFGDNMTIENLAAGYYSVIVSDANSCKDSIQDIPISFVSNFSNNEFNNLKIFPNPSNAIFTITNDKNIESIKVFDLLGNLLKEIEVNSNSFDLNLELDSGSYLLAIKNRDAIVYKTIIIQK